jgi:hypothetical protein
MIAGPRNKRNCTSHTDNLGSRLRLELQDNLLRSAPGIGGPRSLSASYVGARGQRPSGPSYS